MSKVKTKRYDGVRAQAIKWVAAKNHVTREYVRGAIYGTAICGVAPDLKKQFETKYAELQAVLK